MEDYWERCCFDWEDEDNYPPESDLPFRIMPPHPE